MPRPRYRKPPSRLHTALTEARMYLQEMAGILYWGCSTKNYIPYDLYQEIEKRKLLKEKREHLQYLKRRKLISIERIGKRLLVRLTEEGWTEALRDRIKSISIRCKNGSCFVIFDIPEKERYARNMLRNFLKECGMKKLQHSVWMTDYDIVEPLKKLLQRRGLERWIRIVVGNIIPASPVDRLVIRKNYRSS